MTWGSQSILPYALIKPQSTPVRWVSIIVSSCIWQAQMERGLGSVCKVSGTFWKHFCAPAAFLGWALPWPSARAEPSSSSSHLTAGLPWQTALQGWLGMPRAAGKSHHCIGKKVIRVHSCPQETQWERYPQFLGPKSETEILLRLKSEDFRGGVRQKVKVPTQTLSRNKFPFLLFVSSKHQNSEAAQGSQAAAKAKKRQPISF